MSIRDTRQVTGAEKLSRRIRTISAGLSLPVLTNEIGELLLRRMKDRFSREVTPDGSPWTPLAESTLKRREQGGWGSKTALKRTEALFNAIRVIRGSVAGTIFTNTGAGVRIGVADPDIAKYGAVLNKGNNHIPARKFLGVGSLDVKSVDSFLRRRAQTVIGQS